jgi:phosphoglycolate phosphatase
MPFRLALFDFDGTLADSQDWFLGIFDQVADRYGYRRLAPGDRARLRGLDTRAILADLGVAGWKLPMIAKHLRDLATRDIDRIGLFPGVAQMLDDLRAGGVQIAVVSSNSEANARRVLGASAVHVTHFACGANLFGKASKIRAVLRAVRAATRDTILIGDEARDIAAARDTGIASGLVAWGYADPEFLKTLAPDLFFARMDEIAPALMS